MSNMNIVVEFTAGTSISEAVLEAKDKVIAWGVSKVIFNFNGVEVHVSSKQNNLDIEEEWVNCCRNKSKILFF